MITKKRIGFLIFIVLLVVVLFYIGTTDVANKGSDSSSVEDMTTEEAVTEETSGSGYDVQYDENGNMTPESMENIANQELNKGANGEMTEEDKQDAYEIMMEEEAADEYEPPTGAKPW